MPTKMHYPNKEPKTNRSLGSLAGVLLLLVLSLILVLLLVVLLLL